MICSILVFLEETGGAEAPYRQIIIKEQKGQKSYRKIKEQMICSICMEQVGNCFVLVFKKKLLSIRLVGNWDPSLRHN